MGREIVERRVQPGGAAARIAQHHALDHARKKAPPRQIAQRGGGEAAHFRVSTHRPGQRADAAVGDQVQAVMRMIQYLMLVATDEVGQQIAADIVDFPLRGPGRVSLVGVQMAEAGKGVHRIALTGGGHPPGPDRGSDQGTLARRRRQPAAEHELIERLKNQALGTAGGGGDDADVGRPQAVIPDARQCCRTGVKCEGTHRAIIASARRCSTASGRVQLHGGLVELAVDDQRQHPQRLVDRFLDQGLLFLAGPVQHEIGHRLLRVEAARMADA